MFVRPCPSCSHPIEFAEDVAHKRVVCPNCGTVMPQASAPPSPRRLAPAKPGSNTLSVVFSVAIWGPLALWVLYHLSGMIVVCRMPEVSAVQQSAAAAMSATYILAGYALARAADSVLYRGVRDV